MGVWRPRNSSTKCSNFTARGSDPLASKSRETLSLPKRRGSTNRNSRPEASLAMAWVCLAISASPSQTNIRPVIPRCTIHCALPVVFPTIVGADLRPGRAASNPARFCLLGRDGRSLSRSNTICFPTRRTSKIRLDSKVAAISGAGDFSGSGFDPSQTDSITSPLTRRARPRAIVSTSGSSGMKK